MRSCPCVRQTGRRAVALRLAGAAALVAACLSTTGCLIVPVPLPGIKSGRAVDESTAHEITPGTSMDDVLLRLGEPDSISADGRIFAYRFSRTWGAVLWAIGGAGAAQGGAVPVQYGEAVVIEFDADSRMRLAERRAGDWMSPRPEDEPLFYRREYLETLALGGEPVIGQHRVLWWLGPHPEDPAADQRAIGLPPWTAHTSGSQRLTMPGNVFVTASTLWIRPAFATGTASTDYIRVSREAIEAVVSFERATPYGMVLLLIADGRALALQGPPSSGKPAEPSLATWLENLCPVTTRSDARAPQEGWVVWVSTKTAKGKPRAPVHFSCLWLTASGLRFEHFDLGGKPQGSEFLDWAAIVRVDPGSKNRTIIGVPIASADIVCRDGRTLCVAQSTSVTDRTRLAAMLRAGWEQAQSAP